MAIDQGDLFDLPVVEGPDLKDPRFDGETYDPELDQNRLAKQLGRVYDVMRRGAWLTLDEISQMTDDPPASISARLRDLRKRRFGAYVIERRRRGDPADGLFEYRLLKGEAQ